jgi:hypothetical protein
LVGSPPPPGALQVKHESRLAYLRSNALAGFLLSSAALGSLLLALVPPLAFITTALALGVFVYLTWTRQALKPHLAWLVPVTFLGAVWFAVDLSVGVPKVLSTAQFVGGLAVGMFGCFTLERLLRLERQ